MSPDHDVLTLFHEANPVPDLSELSPVKEPADTFLSSAGLRPLPVAEDPVDTSTQKKNKIRYLVPAAAFLTIVVVVGLLFAFNTGDDPGPASPAPSTVPEVATTDPAPVTTAQAPLPGDAQDIATSFITCATGECADDLDLSGVTVNGQPAADLLAFKAALGTDIDSIECHGENPITCEVVGGDEVRKVFRHEVTETWTLEVVEGAVTSADVAPDDAATIDAYVAWLTDAYGNELSGSPQNLASVWIDHADEFRESSAFVPPYQIDLIGTWEMLKGEVWTFDADSLYTVADRDGVYESGTYSFEESIIQITATESGPCPDGTGTYELRFYTADRFGWVLIEDDCGIRGSLLDGLADRVG